MRVLFVSFQHPWPGDIGGRQRLLNLSRELAARHEVTLVTLLPLEVGDRGEWEAFARKTFARVIETDCRAWLPPDLAPRSRWAARASNLRRLLLNLTPRQVQNWTVPAAAEFFRRLAADAPHDVAWIDKGYIAAQARAAGLPRIVVDLMEIESVNQRRANGGEKGIAGMFARVEYRKTRRFESALPNRFWRVVVCSDKDRTFFPPTAVNVRIVPNGINPLPPTPPELELDGNILFVGAMEYGPNHDAVKWFLTDVFPTVAREKRMAAFHIVGQNPNSDIRDAHDGRSVFVHGRVSDVREFYQRASVVVAPIRLGSGTRLKVLEALNLGKALVATGTAVEGIGLRPGIDFFQADSAGALATACQRLLDHPDERRSLAANGHEAVRKRYTWSEIGNAANDAVTL